MQNSKCRACLILLMGSYIAIHKSGTTAKTIGTSQGPIIQGGSNHLPLLHLPGKLLPPASQSPVSSLFLTTNKLTNCGPRSFSSSRVNGEADQRGLVRLEL